MAFFRRPPATAPNYVLYVARHGDLPALRAAVRANADVNVSLGDGWTPLHYAADRADAIGTQMVELLLGAGADVRAVTVTHTQTPLHLCADASNKESARLLLEAGSDVLAKDSRGYTPLHVAVRRNAAQIVSWCVQVCACACVCVCGRGCSAVSVTGRTPLHEAAAAGAVRPAQLLLRAGADVNAQETLQGDTPLHIAARIYTHTGAEGDGAATPEAMVPSSSILHTLIHADADIHARNLRGEDPVATAIRHDRFVVAAAIPRIAAAYRRGWLLLLLAALAHGRASVRTRRYVLERYAELSRLAQKNTQTHVAVEPARLGDVRSRFPVGFALTHTETRFNEARGADGGSARSPSGEATREGILADPAVPESPRVVSNAPGDTLARAHTMTGLRVSSSAVCERCGCRGACACVASLPDTHAIARSTSCPVNTFVQSPAAMARQCSAPSDASIAMRPSTASVAAVRSAAASVAAARVPEPVIEDDDPKPLAAIDEAMLSKATIADLAAHDAPLSTSRPVPPVTLEEVTEALVRLSKMPIHVWKVTLSFM